MTLPPCYSWSPVGVNLSVLYEAPQGRRVNVLYEAPQGRRVNVLYEAPQGRRVNVVGGYIAQGPDAGTFRYAAYASGPTSKSKKKRKSLAAVAASYSLSLEEVGPIDGARFVAFLWHFAGRPTIYLEGWKRVRPLVIVLDNYSVHKSEPVKAAQAELAAANITLLYLPSYCPQLSEIEPIWQAVKHHDMQDRSQTQVNALKQNVEQALANKAETLKARRAETTNLLGAAA